MKRLIALITASAALALAGVALGNVLIYDNKFDSKSAFKGIDKLAGGKACQKAWKGKTALEGHVKRGNKECLLDTPVEGDRRQPDHTIQVEGRITKRTDKRVRSKTFLGAALRANKKSNYEVRVFAKGRRYELLKNGAVLEKGRNSAIAALDKRNRVRLSVEGRTVKARVNGKGLAEFRDASPEEVRGRKTALVFGVKGRSKKDGYVRVGRVKAFVPTP